MNDATMYMIKAVLVLDNDGNRIIANYFDDELFPDVKSQKSFEKKLFNKTSRDQDSEIALLEEMTVIYKSNVDLYFYIVGDSSENELILANMLTTFYDSVSGVLNKNVEKRVLLANLHQILLLLDEMIDSGIVMDSELDSVMAKIGMGGPSNMSSLVGLDAEQTVNNVLQQAKEFKWGSILS